jgi:hypothetical protein
MIGTRRGPWLVADVMNDMTTTFEITAFVNVSEDHYFEGYRPVHPIAEVATFTVQATDVHAAAEAAFTVGSS